jgi:mannitol-1-phosphate/altronate dehydrogenase
MFEGLQAKYDWVCDTVEYPSAKALLRALDTEIIAPVLAMEAKIAEKRARSRAVRRISE